MELTVVTQTITSSTVIVKLVGGVDVANYPSLEDGINQMLESGVQGLVLDLSGLTSISSAGLGAIAHLSTTLADRGGKVIVAIADEKQAELVELLGLSEILTLAKTPEAGKKALAALKLS